MKIQIAMAQEVAENIDFIKRSDINLISIRDTNPPPVLQHYYDIIDQANLNHILIVNFDDLVTPLSPERAEKPPNKEDISRILEWARERIKDNNKGFIVHCTGGVSRSSAVAILVKYLQDPENALKAINPIYHSPNQRVLDLGEELLNTRSLKEPTQKLMEEFKEKWLEELNKNNNPNL